MVHHKIGSTFKGGAATLMNMRTSSAMSINESASEDSFDESDGDFILAEAKALKWPSCVVDLINTNRNITIYYGNRKYYFLISSIMPKLHLVQYNCSSSDIIAFEPFCMFCYISWDTLANTTITLTIPYVEQNCKGIMIMNNFRQKVIVNHLQELRNYDDVNPPNL